jgi:hypothetical protein
MGCPDDAWGAQHDHPPAWVPTGTSNIKSSLGNALCAASCISSFLESRACSTVSSGRSRQCSVAQAHAWIHLPQSVTHACHPSNGSALRDSGAVEISEPAFPTESKLQTLITAIHVTTKKGRCYSASILDRPAKLFPLSTHKADRYLHL